MGLLGFDCSERKTNILNQMKNQGNFQLLSDHKSVYCSIVYILK